MLKLNEKLTWVKTETGFVKQATGLCLQMYNNDIKKYNKYEKKKS